MEETEDDRDSRPSADFLGRPGPRAFFGGLPPRFFGANPGGTESKPGGGATGSIETKLIIYLQFQMH